MENLYRMASRDDWTMVLTKEAATRCFHLKKDIFENIKIRTKLTNFINVEG